MTFAPASLTPPIATVRVFFARAVLWVCLRLRLLCGGAAVSLALPDAPLPRSVPVGRAALRVSQRALPLARRGSPLAGIIYRRRGRAHYLRHIYDYGLAGRVRWCFTAWNWRWAKRHFFKRCRDFKQAIAKCHAPLFPD